MGAPRRKTPVKDPSEPEYEVNLTENQLKLVEALESGKFARTTNILADNHGFCPLGVGAEIMVNEGLLTREPHTRDGLDFEIEKPDWYSYANLDGSRSTTVFWDIPEIQEYYGVDSHDPKTGHTTISLMNDSGASFVEIAAHIRKWGMQ